MISHGREFDVMQCMTAVIPYHKKSFGAANDLVNFINVKNSALPFALAAFLIDKISSIALSGLATQQLCTFMYAGKHPLCFLRIVFSFK